MSKATLSIFKSPIQISIPCQRSQSAERSNATLCYAKTNSRVVSNPPKSISSMFELRENIVFHPSGRPGSQKSKRCLSVRLPRIPDACFCASKFWQQNTRPKSCLLLLKPQSTAILPSMSCPISHIPYAIIYHQVVPSNPEPYKCR